MFTTRSTFPSCSCFRTRDSCSRRKNFLTSSVVKYASKRRKEEQRIVIFWMKDAFSRKKSRENRHQHSYYLLFPLNSDRTFSYLHFSGYHILIILLQSFFPMKLWILEDKVYPLLLPIVTRVIPSPAPGTLLAFIKHWLNEWVNK